MGTGDIPVHDAGEGDSHFEDYLGDAFEKVGAYTPEETSQSPSLPLLLKNLLKKPLPVLNPGRRGSKLWLGGRIYHGSRSSLP